MKFIININSILKSFILFCLVISLLSRRVYHSSKGKNLKKGDVDMNMFDEAFVSLAKLSHDMVYADGSSTVTETDVFSDGKVIESDGFRCSYGLLQGKSHIGVLLFRGTVASKWSNLMADIDDKLVPITSKDGKACAKDCLVHNGFQKAYKTKLRTDLRENLHAFYTLNRLKPKEKQYKILYIAGHSLGGALATMAAYDITAFYKSQKITDVKIVLVTFGAPRIGNEAFKKYMDTDAGLFYSLRVTFGKDPIIAVPTDPKYVHCGTEINFTDGKNYKIGKKFADTNDRKGTIKSVWNIITNIKDHMQYKDLDQSSLREAILKAHLDKKKRK